MKKIENTKNIGREDNLWNSKNKSFLMKNMIKAKATTVPGRFNPNAGPNVPNNLQNTNAQTTHFSWLLHKKKKEKKINTAIIGNFITCKSTPMINTGNK